VSTLTFTGGRTNVRALIRGQLALGASMITRATTWLGLTERGATTVNAYEGVAAPAAEAKASTIPAARNGAPWDCSIGDGIATSGVVVPVGEGSEG
jgi:hypothetical protein